MPENLFHEPLLCPVCRAPWKDTPQCHRCGSDRSGLEMIRLKARQLLAQALCHERNNETEKALTTAERSLTLFISREAFALKILLLARAGRHADIARSLKALRRSQSL
ncbi:MAG: hypothetical protein AB9903_35950 [Vulcanimicrobiota bacterium]